jgi:hypothetical protein
MVLQKHKISQNILQDIRAGPSMWSLHLQISILPRRVYTRVPDVSVCTAVHSVLCTAVITYHVPEAPGVY